MARPTTLHRVNDPLANTWNYLRINGETVVVPEREELGSELGGLVASGLGAEMDAWIAKHANSVGEYIVDAGVNTQLIELTVSADEGELSAAKIVVGEGAQAEILIVAESEAEGGEALVADASDATAVATAGNEGAAAASATAGAADAESAAPTSGSYVSVEVHAGAEVHIKQLVALDASKQHFDGLGISLAESAHATIEQYVLDAGAAYLGTEVQLNCAHSELNQELHYLVRNGSKLDVNYLVRQAGAASESAINAYGVLSDGASKTLRDTIDFVRGSVGAVGREQETVILAGDAMVNKSLPTILCSEENMQGDHGATIGSVSPDQAVYLQSRGLDGEGITELFARSVIDNALNAFSEAGHAAVVRAAARILGDALEEE